MIPKIDSPFTRRTLISLALAAIAAGVAYGSGHWQALASSNWSPAHLVGGHPSAALTLAPDAGPAIKRAPVDALAGSPESRLIAIYRLIAANEPDAALQAAEALTRSHPNFRLAQLVQADLLSARTTPLQKFGAAAAAADGKAANDLSVLRDEARLRLAAIKERQKPGWLPSEIVLLPGSVKHVLAVDASRSRLYLFQNGPDGLSLVEDFYVSVGKQGVDKFVEGDQKTPLGVYFTTDRLDPRSLEDRFGSGALPLNYPNAYDKLRGRTGSGILLHGVTASTYSRPPLDSDGCVAMANEDLLRLSTMLPQRDTPIIITKKLTWLPPGALQANKAASSFMPWVQRWQKARTMADQNALQALYTETGGPADGAAELRFKQRVASPPAGFTDLSVLTWHDDKEMMVVTFKELAGPTQKRDRIMRQYWSRSGDEWKIAAEGPVR